jgi:mRNA interferase RelE/StbE
MRVVTKGSFHRDVKKLRDLETVGKTEACVRAAISAISVQELGDVVPISGHPGYSRIRVGKYRIGIYLSGDTLTFLRVLLRRDFYKYFP